MQSVNRYLKTYDSDIMLQCNSKKSNSQFENMNQNIIVGRVLATTTTMATANSHQIQSYDLALSNSSIPETLSSEPTKLNIEDANDDIRSISLPEYHI